MFCILSLESQSTFRNVIFVCLTIDLRGDRSVSLLTMSFEALHIPGILLLFFAYN